jgi:hypothetical protein
MGAVWYIDWWGSSFTVNKKDPKFLTKRGGGTIVGSQRLYDLVDRENSEDGPGHMHLERDRES